MSLLILLPLVSIIVLNLPFKNFMRRNAFVWASLLFLFQIFLSIVRPPAFWNVNLDPFKPLFAMPFLVDDISFVLLLSIGIVGFTSLLIGSQMIKGETHRFNFINLLLLALIGMNANVVVADLFSAYVFLEVTAVSSFILIAMQKKIFALEGAFKYIVMSAISSVMMLLSLALLLFICGSTSYSSIKEALVLSPESFFVKLSMGLFICGLFIKGGVVPFHGWLPDAYSSAPTFVSVLLAGIVTKVSGVYILIRLVVSVFCVSPVMQNVLMAVGLVSIIVGAVAAFGQNDFKRMLAYSSISQVGYIILALGCGTKLAVAAAIFHLFNHAIFKSLLFANAAAVEDRLGTMDMDAMGGLATKMPITGTTSVIGLLSIAGVPPLSGFWSKFMIVMALWISGNHAYAAAALLLSVVTLAYFLSMQRRVFFGKVSPAMEGVREAGFGFVLPVILLSIITVAVGLFFPWVLEHFILPIQGLVGAR